MRLLWKKIRRKNRLSSIQINSDKRNERKKSSMESLTQVRVNNIWNSLHAEIAFPLPMIMKNVRLTQERFKASSVFFLGGQRWGGKIENTIK